MKQNPFLGLRHYDRNDYNIFSGREDEIERCCQFLDSTSTKLLIIHGQSGAGKSSLISAGILPALESWNIIECNAQENIVDTLWNRMALDGPRSQDELITELVSSRKAHFLGVDRTIVVIDQCEELFRVGTENIRQILMDFIWKVINQGENIRILLVVRTEYQGRLINELKIDREKWDSVGEYYLAPLTNEKSKEFINSHKLSPDNQIPIFSEQVSQDIINSAFKEQKPQDHQLAYIQLICQNYYDDFFNSKISNGQQIKRADIKQIPDRDKLIDEYIDSAIANIYEKSTEIKASIDLSSCIVFLKKFLTEFTYLYGNGGMIGKDYLEEKDIPAKLRENGCSEKHICNLLPFILNLRFSDDNRKGILRKLENETGGVIRYTLIHDLIASAIRKWNYKWSAYKEHDVKILTTPAIEPICEPEQIVTYANDGVWDHMILDYANTCERDLLLSLGIKLRKLSVEGPLNKAMEPGDILKGVNSNEWGILSFPDHLLHLVPKNVIDIGILNTFTGYTIQSKIEPPVDLDAIIERVKIAVNQKRIGIEDEGAIIFLDDLTKVDCGELIPVAQNELLTGLEKGTLDFIIGFANTQAKASIMHYPIYIGQETLIREGRITRNQKIHNRLYLQYPEEISINIVKFSSGEKHTAINSDIAKILRIGSVFMYISEKLATDESYLREFIMHILKTEDETFGILDPSHFSEEVEIVFEKCFQYSSFCKHLEHHYPMERIKFIAKETSFHVYNLLHSLRQEYLTLVVDISKSINKTSDDVSSVSVLKNAEDHAKVLNFYDAWRIMYEFCESEKDRISKHSPFKV